MAATEQSSGIISGGATGFQIGGPLGLIIGAAVGGVFGGRSMRKRRRREAQQLKKNTATAYNITKDNYSSISTNRQDINNTYAGNVARGVTELASSGRSVDSAARDRIVGRFAQQRDIELENVDIAEERFQQGAGYKLVQDDYNYLTQLNEKRDFSDVDTSTPTAYSIRTEGRSGESFFNEEQKKLLRSYTDPDEYQFRNNTANFASYAESIMPTMDEYFAGRFGTDEQRATYDQTITDRITSANEIYDESLLQTNVANQRRRENLFGD